MDLYQAVVLYNEGRLFEARRLCARRGGIFRWLLPAEQSRAVPSAARPSFAARPGSWRPRKRSRARAIERLAHLEAPVLHYQAHFLMGQIQQASGDLPGAYDSCQKARESLETLRSSLHGEELKIAFMKNRLEVYENLVELCLIRGERPEGAEESFGYIEMAKSRSLAELLMRSGPASGRPRRDRASWCAASAKCAKNSTGITGVLKLSSCARKSRRRSASQSCRKKLWRTKTSCCMCCGKCRSRRAQAMARQSGSLAAIRACMPPEAALVEYFSLKDQFIAAVVTHDDLKIVPADADVACDQSAAHAAFSNFEIQAGRGICADV